MKEFAGQGLSEYIAMPMNGGGMYHNAMTVATKRDAGFSEADFTTIRRMLDLFALHVERHIALRIADNTLNAYLGETAAAKVLRGTIKRGSGEPMRAIIWVSDLRGFTDLSGRLGDANMIALLNAYFECLAGAVLRHGGEVLKFMGDGLLAVFPIQGTDDAKTAASAAVAAAQDALTRLDQLNAEAPSPLDTFGGWNPLRTGIALHEGDVFFGNIGAPERLDFTVIGSAVNEASRVEALQKTLGRSLLITEAAARHLDCELDDLGEQRARGGSEDADFFAVVSRRRRTAPPGYSAHPSGRVAQRARTASSPLYRVRSSPRLRRPRAIHPRPLPAPCYSQCCLDRRGEARGCTTRFYGHSVRRCAEG